MARVTVEDCVLVVPNRFELVALASRRAKDIASGTSLTLERDNDKNAVVALREIAEETISVDNLRDIVVQDLQHNIPEQSGISEAAPETSEESDEEASAIVDAVSSPETLDQDEGFSFSEDNLDVGD